MSRNFNNQLEEMKEFIKKQNWLLVEGIVDFEESDEGLFELSERLKEIDVILIYDKNNLSDEFSLTFLYQIARNENVEIREYQMGNDVN
jgi:DNA invertase Pin-like site-specific DNA recombinase